MVESSKYTCVKLNLCDIRCTYERNYEKDEASNHKEVYLVLVTINFIEDEDKVPKDEEESIALDRKLICALDEIKKLKKKNTLLEEFLEESKRKKNEDHEKTVVGLKIQVEEEKKIAEVLTSQLNEKEESCQAR